MKNIPPALRIGISVYIYIYNIYIYTDAPAVLLVHVGLAQARPNNIVSLTYI